MRRLGANTLGVPGMTITGDHCEVLADPARLAARVADRLLDLAIAKEGWFSLCLAGGATPQLLYECLAQAPYKDAFPWQNLHVFWGDERCVPPDDARNNAAMACKALLAHVPIPRANIHPVPTQGVSPDAAAKAYQRALQIFYGADQLDPGRPLFDVTLLGLGVDGHTASLFPHSAALMERDAWVVPVLGAADDARITLTYPTLESCRHAAFLVAGQDKAEILGRLVGGDTSLPAAVLQPLGELWVFSDKAAQLQL